MNLRDFYYDLPQELIAQDPLEDRSSSRLMLLDKDTGDIEHHVFKDVINYLDEGDCLVINNTKVMPARLFGSRVGTDAKIEVLLLKRKENNVWETLVRPGKKCKKGTRISFGDGILTGEVIDVVEEGNRLIKFEFDGIFEEILDKLGEMPLPPYITHKLKDKNRYQTVYAKYDGSAAAPTAGLHFTTELLDAIRQKGVRIANVTLHVGLGTFRPVKVENILEHHMHSEFYMVDESDAKIINETKKNGKRVISVGTTSCRTLESVTDENGIVHPGSGWTDIFIYPGYKFKAIDGLITNFHLPESTLLMLVSALAGKDNVMKAYENAVRERYRFFSFGDAMMISSGDIKKHVDTGGGDANEPHEYHVKTIGHKDVINVEVPGSKSITNRALMLAALGNKECLLKGVLFSDDSRAFLSCLTDLGFDVSTNETKKEARVSGTNGIVPRRTASINVGSAGTAARFLTVMLSVAGGDYVLDSSEQMKKRPMGELIAALRDAGVDIVCLEEEGHFPFEIHSNGLDTDEITIDTTVSSQYASAFLMSGVVGGLKINLTGSRTNGSYIKITLKMMQQFGIDVQRKGDTFTVAGGEFGIDSYQVEPDASAACYFYAMAPLLRSNVVVRNLYGNSMQGDMKFVSVMEQLGCVVTEEEDGIHINGTALNGYGGVDIVMKDFSDQTMTMAVVAAFADSETVIRDVGHIRMQESDRVSAIVTELSRLGIKAESYENDGHTNIRIVPGKMNGADIETYNDHRIAMAFTLAGLVTENVTILNPMCCKKTFENYFDIIDCIVK